MKKYQKDKFYCQRRDEIVKPQKMTTSTGPSTHFSDYRKTLKYNGNF